MIRQLGKNWRRMHRFTYVIAIGAVLHYWWLTKVGVYDPVWVTVILTILLGYRLMVKYGVLFKLPSDTGMEVPER